METDKSENRKKIGLFGGTLDPIHFGHLRAAEEVHEALALHEIWFIPAFLPPHKAGKDLTSFGHRLRMAELAIKGISHFCAKALEAERQGISYSVDLLRQVNSRFGDDCIFYFIIGTDTALELDSWKNWQELPKLANLVIIKRPSVSVSEVKAKFKEIYPEVNLQMEDVPSREHGTVITFDTTGLDISSTAIRNRIKEGRSVRFLLPDNVREYIMKNSLYTTKTESGPRKRSAAPPVSTIETAGQIYKEILDNKGERIVVLDMSGTSPVADFFIIANGRSTRHVQGMADRMKKELGRMGIKCRSTEGEKEGKWILMDFNDVVVHLFYGPVRAFYDLEGLWAEAPRLVMTEPGLSMEENDHE